MALFSSFLKVSNALLPPRCPACAVVVSSDHTFCPDCWLLAPYLSPFQCKRCGIPLNSIPSFDQTCLECYRCPPPFSQAKSVFAYDDFSAPLVLALKHGDRCDLAATFANWMAQSGSDFFEQGHLIVPVPLHWKRLARRRFNQSALMARALSHKTGLPFCPEAIKRIRHTPSQGTLSKSARKLNLRKAFHSPPNKVHGKKIILVDDVLTTGATVVGCCNELLKQGAEEVMVLTLCRVVYEKT